jgi:hypothetical protein
MFPKYPVYIVSKGRWESRLTAKALAACEIPFRVVIEPQEHAEYAAVIDPTMLLVLPFSNLGQGSIPARNWIWEHAISEGHARHWILDDNIKSFRRLNHGKRAAVRDASTFCAAESFIDRYENIALAGMQYTMFAVTGSIYEGGRGWQIPPFNFNTRVYSCILIDNALPHRWRGRYNEDTDLSLRILKDGYCTILFYAFLCDKAQTLTMKGGNTDELYKDDGRLKMAQSLQQQHPDVVKITRKWGRWQHHVDYRPFKNNRLILKPGIVIPGEPNEYGMKLVQNAL